MRKKPHRKLERHKQIARWRRQERELEVNLKHATQELAKSAIVLTVEGTVSFERSYCRQSALEMFTEVERVDNTVLDPAITGAELSDILRSHYHVSRMSTLMVGDKSLDLYDVLIMFDNETMGDSPMRATLKVRIMPKDVYRKYQQVRDAYMEALNNAPHDGRYRLYSKVVPRKRAERCRIRMLLDKATKGYNTDQDVSDFDESTPIPGDYKY